MTLTLNDFVVAFDKLRSEGVKSVRMHPADVRQICGLCLMDYFHSIKPGDYRPDSFNGVEVVSDYEAPRIQLS